MSTQELTARYPTFSHFEAAYSVATLVNAARKDPERCKLTPLSPTVWQIRDAYGESADYWLASVLDSVGSYVNISHERKMTKEQTLTLASSIIVAHPALKCSEVYVFLFELFGGAFGQIAYGYLSGDVIGDHLRTYLARRRELEASRRRELQHKAEAINRAIDRETSMTFEEWKQSDSFKALPPEEQERAQRLCAPARALQGLKEGLTSPKR